MRRPYPYRRGVVFILSGTSQRPDLEHRFIICNDPCEDGFVLLVPICSWVTGNPQCDPTCRIAANEYAPLTRDSYVAYFHARKETAETIETGVEEGILEPCEDIREFVFLRVKNNILNSPNTKPSIREYWEKITK